MNKIVHHKWSIRNAKYILYEKMIDSLLDTTKVNFERIHFKKIQECFVKNTDGLVDPEYSKSNLAYRIRTERDKSCYNFSSIAAPCNYLKMDIDSLGYLYNIRGSLDPDTIYHEDFYR